jgi:hypothetical protein
MKKTLFFAVEIAIALLSGCATTANYEKSLNDYVGKPELELIQTWGPPASTYEYSGIRYLTYVRSGNMYLPGAAPTYQTTLIGNTAYTNAYGGTPAMNVALSCKTTFEIRNQRIVTWRWEGNNCKATAPK